MRAFSLIELMIVITIIGILAAVAVPAYNNYIIRSHVGTALSTISKLKVDMEEYYMLNNQWPTTAILGIEGGTPGHVDATYRAGISSKLRAMTVTTPAAADGLIGLDFDPDQFGLPSGYYILHFLGTASAQGITWQCYASVSTHNAGNQTIFPSDCQGKSPY